MEEPAETRPNHTTQQRGLTHHFSTTHPTRQTQRGACKRQRERLITCSWCYGDGGGDGDGDDDGYDGDDDGDEDGSDDGDDDDDGYDGGGDDDNDDL